ncbi:CBS domain-containing protein [Parathalassolituus penaei]|uniref:CBS domain-containing protein n=1 Tax=Parathalassolituus penaei TaxID=2997323 RepID=A0A9X3IQR0_9GAMM|nr:CBS domain-containing protein [Parathalassolituus penaei]MCY0964432.1 CBS domain-containing protein [Parathalassolituus penaei]
MTLMVFDMGLRISTPLPPAERTVSASSAIRATRRIRRDMAHTAQADAYQQVASRHEPVLAHSVVADLMSSPVIVLPEDASIADAHALLAQHDIRHLPLVSETGPLALLSERDMLRSSRQHSDQSRALTIASRPLFCTCTDTPARQAADLMLRYRLGCLPVCDDDQKLIGMLTRSDLLRGLALPGQLEVNI